jgi:polyisoprenoid-binding protein YceI
MPGKQGGKKNMRQFLRVSALVLAMAVPSFAQTETWKVDPAHSKAVFSVRHLGISTVRGEFSGASGEAQIDDKDATKSQISVSLDVATVNTGQSGRDNDLKSANFFDAAQFPTMSFKSKNVSKAADGHLKLAGDLTIHGVTKEVTFDIDGPTPAINDPFGKGGFRRGASATAKINRKDFGILWNHLMDSGGLVVSDEVSITIDLEFVKKA